MCSFPVYEVSSRKARSDACGCHWQWILVSQSEDLPLKDFACWLILFKVKLLKTFSYLVNEEREVSLHLVLLH